MTTEKYNHRDRYHRVEGRPLEHPIQDRNLPLTSVVFISVVNISTDRD